MPDEEHDERNTEHDDERLGQPSGQDRLHPPRVSRAMASMCGVWGNMSTGCTHSSR
jgi:hypothetical protein